jgi:integrase
MRALSAVICITGALQRQNGRLERSATKTEASVRVLALPPNQVVSLRRHQARQNAECAAAPRWRASGMVFTSTIGTPLAPETLSQHFKATQEAAGLPIIRFHDLRHTCATLMLKRGVSPRLIQEVLGHSQITTTMNTYTHVLEEVQREAVAVLDALFDISKSANSATNPATMAECDGAAPPADAAEPV